MSNAALMGMLPQKWTAIASRPRLPVFFQTHQWCETPNAPLTIAEARNAYDAGVIEMATRYDGTMATLLVCRRRKPTEPRACFKYIGWPR